MSVGGGKLIGMVGTNLGEYGTVFCEHLQSLWFRFDVG